MHHFMVYHHSFKMDEDHLLMFHFGFPLEEIMWSLNVATTSMLVLTYMGLTATRNLVSCRSR